MPEISRFFSHHLTRCVLIVALIGLIFTVTPNVGAPNAPITLDSVSTADNDGGGPVAMLSWSHTVASGASILIVGVSEASFEIPPTVVSVTFGSSSLTPIGAGQSTPSRVELWSLLNPAAGPATVKVLLSGVETGVFGGAVSFFNVIGTTSFTTTNDQGSTVTTPSISVPAVSGELVMDVLATCSNCLSSPTAPVPSPGSTSTYISTETNGELFAAASTEPAASPVTLSWVYTSNYWAMAAVALIPATVSECVTASTGGSVCFAADAGVFTSLTASALSSVSTAPPARLTFPYGLFSFTISGLAAGATVTVTLTLPAPLPAGTFSYWKFESGAWTQFPGASLDSTRTIITLTFTASASGTVTDPGGPAFTPPKLAVSHVPVGGVMLPSVGFSVLLPWVIVLSLLGVVSVEAFTIKRRAKRR